MKKYLLILFFAIGSFAVSKAQDGENRAEKIQSLKIAFITQKLQLTPDEAQKFWPVYNQYQNDVQNLQLNRKDGNVIEDEEKLLDIRKKYVSSFEKIIGPQKTNNLFNAERDFRA